MAIPFIPAMLPAWAFDADLTGVASWRFYETGTTDLVDTYQDADMVTENANPLPSNTAGVFYPVFLDQAITYRAQLLGSGGTVVRDFDPYNPADGFIIGTASITAAMLAAGAAVASLGFTPLNKAGDTATGDLILDLDPTTLNSLSAGFRGAPSGTHDATYTMVLADAGTTLLHTSATAHTWTIPPNASAALPIGTIILAVNSGSGAVMLARGAGVTLRLAGNSTDGNKTLAQYGVAALLKYATNDWLASGAGIS